jgi:hypothetical protein
MWGRMCTTGVGPAGSVDRAEDMVGVVLCLSSKMISQLSMFGTATCSHSVHVILYNLIRVATTLYTYTYTCTTHSTCSQE